MELGSRNDSVSSSSSDFDKEKQEETGEESSSTKEKSVPSSIDVERNVSYQTVTNNLGYLPVTMAFSSPLANFSFVLTEDNRLLAVGRNDKGQLGLGHTKNAYYYTEVTDKKIKGNVEKIILGSAHTFFKTTDGKVFAVGNNSHGQLGIGSKADYKLQLTEVKIPDGKISSIIAGGNHSFFLYTEKKILNEDAQELKAAKLYAVGDNSHGQLGLGDTIDRNSPTLVTVPKLYSGVENDPGFVPLVS